MAAHHHAGHVEVVGFEDLHRRLVEEGRRARRELDLTAALEEAERLRAELERAGWQPVYLERQHEEDPPVLRVRLAGNVTVFIVVYPPRWSVILSGVLDILEHLLEEPEGDRYKVIVFYSRRGRLGLAAYLYLGFVIEYYGVGILFVNGGPGEVVEVVRTLEETGRYIPEEEDKVPVDAGG